MVVLHDPDTDDATHERVCRILIDMGASAVAPLVEAICADPKRGRDDAAAILCEIGEAAVEPLIGCFDHHNPEVRATTAFLFTGLHDALGRAHRALMGLLDDPDELVRQSAAYALGALECRSAVPKLIALATRPLQMPPREAGSEAWAEAYPYDSCAAVDALGQLGDLRAVRPLIFLVESQGPDGPMYDEAVRALGLLGDGARAIFVRSAFEDGRSEGAFAEALAALQGRGALDDLLELGRSFWGHHPVLSNKLRPDSRNVQQNRTAGCVIISALGGMVEVGVDEDFVFCIFTGDDAGDYVVFGGSDLGINRRS